MGAHILLIASESLLGKIVADKIQPDSKYAVKNLFGSGIDLRPYKNSCLKTVEFIIADGAHHIFQALYCWALCKRLVFGYHCSVLMSPVLKHLSKQIRAVPKVSVKPAFGDTELACKLLNINAADTLCFQGLGGAVPNLIYFYYTHSHFE